MSSYFAEQYHIEFFVAGFDLILDRLPERRILDIIAEIETELEEYPNDPDALLSLDALYEVIGDRDGAIGALTRYRNNTRNSLFLLRKARHLVQKGEKKEADQLLQTVIQRAKKESEESEEWNIESDIEQLCALLAYGRRGDQQSFTEMWYRLLEEYDLMEPVPEEDTLEHPEDYSFFEILSFREHIEGLGYLIQFNIHNGREATTVSLVYTIRNCLERLLENIYKDLPDYGFTESLPAFPVIHAIAEGGTRIVEEIHTREDVITNQRESDAINRALGAIREFGAKAGVMDTLIRWSSDPDRPAPEMINLLREQSGGNDDLIAVVTDNLGFRLPIRIVEELLSGITVSSENRSRLMSQKLDRLEAAHRYTDALAFVDQHPVIELEDGEYEDLYFKALVESHKEREAFDYLREQIENGHMLDQHSRLFDLALSLDRIDEILLFNPFFETYEIREGLLLVNAYEQMSKKDVKRGLELIEQAKGAGLSRDTALVFTARFLLLSGFPKRVVGLSEKMLKHKIPAQHVYPLLIQAYRDLGREGEAKAAEEAYKRMEQQVPDGGVRKG